MAAILKLHISRAFSILAVLLLTIPAASQHISGKWKAKKKVINAGGNSYELHIFEMPERFQKNAASGSILYIGVWKEKIWTAQSETEFFFIGEAVDGYFYCNPLAELKSNKRNEVEYKPSIAFKYLNEKKDEYLKDEQYEYSFEKKNDKGNDEYRDLAFSILENFKIENVQYSSDDGDNIFKSFQQGNLKVTINNNTPYKIVKGLYVVTLHGKDANSPMFLKTTNNGTVKTLTEQTGVVFYPNYSTTINEKIITGSELTDDSVSITVVLRMGGIEIDKKSFVISGKSSEELAKTFKASDPGIRNSAINYIFGNPEFDEEKARISLEQLVKNGDRKAVIWKAILTGTGASGYALNNKEARFWTNDYLPDAIATVRDNARAGDPESMYLLYQTHSLELSKEADYELLLEKAATMGYQPAVFKQALVQLSRGNLSQAEETFKGLYAAGFLKAGFELAKLYEDANDNAKKAEAASILAKLVEAKSNDALLKSAENKIRLSTDADFKEAKKLIYTAIDQNSLAAMKFMAKLLLSTPDADSNKSSAINLLIRAANLKDIEAMILLSKLYIENGDVTSQEQAVTWIRRAADLGNAYSMQILGTAYSDGSLTLGKDDVLSNYWKNKALEHGFDADKKSKNNLFLIPPNFEGFVNDFATYQPSQYYERRDASGTVIANAYYDDNALDAFFSSAMPNLILPAVISLLLSNPPKIDINTYEFVSSSLTPDSSSQILNYAISTSNTVVINGIRENDQIDVKVFGNLRWNLSDFDFRGILSPDPFFTDRGIEKSWPFGGIMMKFNESGPLYPDLKNYLLKSSGQLRFQVNDKYNDHRGYYCIDLTIKRRIAGK